MSCISKFRLHLSGFLKKSTLTRVAPSPSERSWSFARKKVSDLDLVKLWHSWNTTTRYDFYALLLSLLLQRVRYDNVKIILIIQITFMNLNKDVQRRSTGLWCWQVVNGKKTLTKPQIWGKDDNFEWKYFEKMPHCTPSCCATAWYTRYF